MAETNAKKTPIADMEAVNGGAGLNAANAGDTLRIPDIGEIPVCLNCGTRDNVVKNGNLGNYRCRKCGMLL